MHRVRRARAQTTTDYIVIISLVVIALLGVVVVFGNELKEMFFGSSQDLRTESAEQGGGKTAGFGDAPSGGQTITGSDKVDSEVATKRSDVGDPAAKGGTGATGSGGSSGSAGGSEAGGDSDPAAVAPGGGGGGSGGSGSSPAAASHDEADASDGSSFWDGPGALVIVIVVLVAAGLLMFGVLSNVQKLTG